MRKGLLIGAAVLMLAACGDESADMLIAQDGDHPVCKSAKSSLNYKQQWLLDAMAMRDRGIWDQKKLMMVLDRMNEYAPKIDPAVRDYSGFCEGLDRIRGHYAF